MSVASRCLDNSRWIVVYRGDRSPARYYLYDREKGRASFLFSADRRLEGLSLSGMRYTTIKSRDGLDLILYYTLPTWSDKNSDGIPDGPLPTVLMVHGGPWERDIWGYDPLNQLLANRGYAVIQVNYRGSSGLGKRFDNKGDREWGGKMQDDLLDAVLWSTKMGITDPERVAIVGSSYGGYAALAAMTFTPEVFACAVDICGPSNLTSFLLSLPGYWKPAMEIKLKRIGDYRTEEGRESLRLRSPFTYAQQIKKPILICQGGNDPRVDRNESDQIVRALQEKNVSVVYAFYPDEGHGLILPGNGMSFYAIMEAFLANYLRGRHEPLNEALNGSSLTVPVGSNQLPGLAEALAWKGA